MYKCKYCDKECKNKNSLTQHEIRCSKNPNRIKIVSNFIKYNEQIKAGVREKTCSNQYVKAKLLGLPKPEISEETRWKIGNYWRGRKHTTEEIEKISQGMKRAVRERPESYSASNVNGRVKKVEYNEMIFDSSWEVIVAKYLEDNQINWIRPNTGIPYIYDGSEHLYFPDFYLIDYDLYIETKGLVRDKDPYKWDAVDNLIIIGAKQIQEIKDGIYKLPIK